MNGTFAIEQNNATNAPSANHTETSAVPVVGQRLFVRTTLYVNARAFTLQKMRALTCARITEIVCVENVWRR